MKKIVQISLIASLVVAAYFLRGYPTEQRIFPLLLVYIAFLNHYQILETQSHKKAAIKYSLYVFNLLFLPVALIQGIFVFLGFEQMLAVVIFAALFQMSLIAVSELRKS